MEPTPTEQPPPDRDEPTIERNLRAIAEFETRALEDRSLGEKIGDSAARVIGSMAFVLFHLAWFLAWIAINLGIVPVIAPFDRFPFGLLTLVVSLEAIFLSLFLLISQNRMTRQADKRAHLDLQINLLAEAETTKVLRVLDRIAARVGVPKDEIATPDLDEPTDIVGLATRVESKIPESS
jgi:uncharacterized membrane protein